MADDMIGVALFSLYSTNPTAKFADLLVCKTSARRQASSGKANVLSITIPILM